jgi:hypothetical protein
MIDVNVTFLISTNLDQKLTDIAVKNGYSKNQLLELIIKDLSYLDYDTNPEMTINQEFARALRRRWGPFYTINEYAKMWGIPASRIYTLLKRKKEPRINSYSYAVWHDMNDLILEYRPQD